jgi:hypothetical protein
MDEPGRVPPLGYPQWLVERTPAWFGKQFPAPPNATATQNLGAAIAQVALLHNPMVLEAARPGRLPTDEERQAMTKAVEEAAFERAFQGPGAERAAAAQAIAMIVDRFGIDLRNVTGGALLYDPNLQDEGETDGKTRVVTIGPRALQAGGAELAATILHEVTHANQAALRGDVDPPSPVAFAYEVMAYQTAEVYAEELGLDEAYLAENAAFKQTALDALHPDNRSKLLEDGRYWELDPALPSPTAEAVENLNLRPS